uniref:Centrosomal protein of 44 kDa n=1 Tax=Macrostomum lignano TaxID=282301 RepID=A0A1I8F7H3_9PLAT
FQAVSAKDTYVISKAYLYQLGFCRFCTVKYTPSSQDLDNMFAHLTNVSIQKHGNEYNAVHAKMDCVQNLRTFLEGTRGKAVSDRLFDDMNWLIIQLAEGRLQRHGQRQALFRVLRLRRHHHRQQPEALADRSQRVAFAVFDNVSRPRHEAQAHQRCHQHRHTPGEGPDVRWSKVPARENLGHFDLLYDEELAQMDFLASERGKAGFPRSAATPGGGGSGFSVSSGGQRERHLEDVYTACKQKEQQAADASADNSPVGMDSAAVQEKLQFLECYLNSDICLIQGLVTARQQTQPHSGGERTTSAGDALYSEAEAADLVFAHAHHLHLLSLAQPLASPPTRRLPGSREAAGRSQQQQLATSSPPRPCCSRSCAACCGFWTPRCTLLRLPNPALAAFIDELWTMAHAVPRRPALLVCAGPLLDEIRIIGLCSRLVDALDVNYTASAAASLLAARELPDGNNPHGELLRHSVLVQPWPSTGKLRAACLECAMADLRMASSTAMSRPGRLHWSALTCHITPQSLKMILVLLPQHELRPAAVPPAPPACFRSVRLPAELKGQRSTTMATAPPGLVHCLLPDISACDAGLPSSDAIVSSAAVIGANSGDKTDSAEEFLVFEDDPSKTSPDALLS